MRRLLVLLIVVLGATACTNSGDKEQRSAIAANATRAAVIFGHAPGTDAGSVTTLTLSKDGLELRKVEAGADGEYRFENLDAGHYSLDMDSVGRSTAKTCDATKQVCLIPPARSERRLFDLAAGEQHREDF
jgi:hypothetical protein